MKNLLVILMTLTGFTAVAQVPIQTIGTTNNRVKARGQFQADSGFILPSRIATNLTTADSGAIYYNPTTKRAKIYDGLTWGNYFGVDSVWKVSGGGTDTLKYSAFGVTRTVGTFSGSGSTIDTTSLSNRINLKLNIADTANIRPRLYAGTNISITGTYPNLTVNSTGSAGSIEYVKQGYGIRVDSTGREYTVRADSTVMSSKAYNNTFYRSVSQPNDSSIVFQRPNGTGDTLVINAPEPATPEDSINTFGKEVQMVAGVLKVDRSAGANTWSILGDATHDNLGVTSVTADATKVTVNYYAGSKVITMLGVQDETMSNTAQTNDGTTFYNYGPYTLGARVFESYAEFNIRRTTHGSFYLGWTGSAWSVSSGTIKGSYSGTSPAWTISWSAGRLRIENNSFPSRKVPSVQMYASGTGSGNLKYIPSVELISDVWVDIYFYNAETGAALTDASPPSGFALYIDYGTMAVPVNPLTEDFGNTGVTNFWIFGLMKK